MLNVLPCWASSRIQIKSINKDTFCFHLKLSPPAGPQGGEVTAALITGRSLGLGEAPLSGACWPSVERGVRGLGVSKPAWCNRGGLPASRAQGAVGWGDTVASGTPAPQASPWAAPGPSRESGWPGRSRTHTFQEDGLPGPAGPAGGCLHVCPSHPPARLATGLPRSKCEAGDKASGGVGRSGGLPPGAGVSSQAPAP